MIFRVKLLLNMLVVGALVVLVLPALLQLKVAADSVPYLGLFLGGFGLALVGGCCWLRVEFLRATTCDPFESCCWCLPVSCLVGLGEACDRLHAGLCECDRQGDSDLDSGADSGDSEGEEEYGGATIAGYTRISSNGPTRTYGSFDPELGETQKNK